MAQTSVEATVVPPERDEFPAGRIVAERDTGVRERVARVRQL